jgi:hypothetical protein
MNFHVGSTEGGSSGGPLFDQNQRLRGTLTGGPESPCSIAYYGRFHSFWNETAIAQFLDPLGTGATELDGFDPFGGPPVPPVIASISPDDVEAFLPAFVTLSGSGFSTVSSLEVGSVTLTPPGGFTILDDSSILFTPPAPSSLGAVAVEVTGPAGTSNSVTLTYIECDPPKLSVPSFTFQGLTLNWSYGGGAGDSHYLLYALSPATFEFNGFDILAAFNILFVDALDAIGTGSFGVPIPASAAGLTLYSQGVTIDGGGFVGASLVASTVIF